MQKTVFLVVVTRREALRLFGLGLSGLLAPAALVRCGQPVERAPGEDLGAAQSDSSQPLARFDENRPAGPAPNLPRRVAWANTDDTEIFVALGKGIASAADDTGLEYLTATAAGDPARNIDQMETFLARGIGSIAVQPLDQASQRPVMARALDQGVCVQGIITGPSTLQIAASQYRIGFTQGKAAADYAVGRLGGRADVAYFNSDRLSPQLRLRHQGVLDGLRTGGDGVRVVSDLPSDQAGLEGGFAVMSTVMQSHPAIKIVLGPDTSVTGAYRALEQAGKLADDMYLSGVDGDANALNLVKRGGPYRASLAFAWPLIGYGIGRFAADWVEGKDIPRVMVAESILLDSAASVTTFLADNANPALVYSDRSRFERYVPLRGNVSYATRRTIWKKAYVPQ